MSRIYSVIFNLDGKTLASIGYDGNIRLWDAATGLHQQTITGHTSSVYSVAFNPDGRTLASGERRKIHLWDTFTGQHKYTLMANGDAVAFNPDGRTLASGEWQKIHLWDVKTGVSQQTLIRDTDILLITSVAFSPDGRTLVSGTYDGPVFLKDVETGENQQTLIGHTDAVGSVAFSPDGQTIASASRDKTVRLWDADTGRHLRTLAGHTGSVYSVAFSPDGNTLASSGGRKDHTIRLWDADTGRHLRTLAGHTGSVESVAFSPDGRTIASGSADNTIRLWDTFTGRHLRTLTGHTGSVYSVAFSLDGRTIASGSADGTVILWNIIPTTYATFSLLPSLVQSPTIGEQLTLSLNIANGEAVAGYQVRVQFAASALRYVSSKNGDYLPENTFFVPPVISGNRVTLASTSFTGESRGNGTLATLTFEVIAVKVSTVTLFDVLLTNSKGESSRPQIEVMQITEPPHTEGDMNRDGIVNIQDLMVVAANFGQTEQNKADVNGDGVVNIVDLTLVAGAISNAVAAPAAWMSDLEFVTTREQVHQWLREARQRNLTDPAFQRGIAVLEQLLAALTPKKTALLPNYPNPFNPETWIPYQLAEPAAVTLTIYAVDGTMVRTLALGHQPVGIYQDRSRAAYWNGRNALGEPVASGVYFYTLAAGEFSATRKMLIRK